MKFQPDETPAEVRRWMKFQPDETLAEGGVLGEGFNQLKLRMEVRCLREDSNRLNSSDE